MNEYTLKKVIEYANKLAYPNKEIITLPITKNNVTNIDTDFIKSNELKLLLNDVLFNTQVSDITKEFNRQFNAVHTNIVNNINKIRIRNFVLREVIDILRTSDETACLVGGCIRDMSIGITPKDYDFVSSLDYKKLIDIFKVNGYNVTEQGKHFLVLNVSKENQNFEIACFRKDNTYVDGRRPSSVEIGNIEDDCKRRDFTINAGYLRLSDSRLLDPSTFFIEDIRHKKLRYIGKPEERIKEDFLRVFRFYRFVSKGFSPDKKSLKATRMLFEIAIKNTNAQRIQNEIEKIIHLYI